MARAAGPEVLLRRAPLTTRFGTRWNYDYTTPEPVEYRDSRGTVYATVPAGGWITYGGGLASLQDMLKRKHGRTVKIVETWKAA